MKLDIPSIAGGVIVGLLWLSVASFAQQPTPAQVSISRYAYQWVPLTTHIVDGYYWYRDKADDDIEIVRSQINEITGAREMVFAFDYGSQYSMSVVDLLKRLPNAEVTAVPIPKP